MCVRVHGVAAGTVPQAGFKPTFPRFSLMKSSGREGEQRGCGVTEGEMWGHKKREKSGGSRGQRFYTKPKTKNRRAGTWGKDRRYVLCLVRTSCPQC